MNVSLPSARRRPTKILVALALCVTGCGALGSDRADRDAVPEEDRAGAPSPAGSSGGSDDDAPSSASGATDSSDGGALRIADLSSTVTTITGGQLESTDSATVTFIAIVTDTRGLDAIAGGQLLDEAGAVYGAFGAAAQKGTYTATLQWDEVNRVRPLDFLPPGGERKLTAKFFDNAGDIAKATITLKLACRAANKAIVGACAGACTDQRVDPSRCGACGTSCADGLECKSAACSPPTLAAGSRTTCIRRASVQPTTTCSEVCAHIGKTCTDALFSGTSPWAYPTSACSLRVASGPPSESISCDDAVGALAPHFVAFDCTCK